MAGATASVAPKTQCAKKVSKPLMEKKRRARINKCLNQLKSLLESVSSNNIRKRKLEKADILELTVKHLRYLQNTERGMAQVCDSAEYQAGYRTCLATVSRYLLSSDTDSHSCMLTHLTSSNIQKTADFRTTESEHTPVLTPANALHRSHKVSVKSDAKFPNPQQISDRNYCFMPKRTEISDVYKVEANGFLNLKTSLKDSKHVESFILKHNYWRPW